MSSFVSSPSDAQLYVATIFQGFPYCRIRRMMKISNEGWRLHQVDINQCNEYINKKDIPLQWEQQRQGDMLGFRNQTFPAYPYLLVLGMIISFSGGE